MGKLIEDFVLKTDRPTDRPWKRLREAPSQSLKNFTSLAKEFLPDMELNVKKYIANFPDFYI